MAANASAICRVIQIATGRDVSLAIQRLRMHISHQSWHHNVWVGCGCRRIENAKQIRMTDESAGFSNLGDLSFYCPLIMGGRECFDCVFPSRVVNRIGGLTQRNDTVIASVD